MVLCANSTDATCTVLQIGTKFDILYGHDVHSEIKNIHVLCDCKTYMFSKSTKLIQNTEGVRSTHTVCIL